METDKKLLTDEEFNKYFEEITKNAPAETLEYMTIIRDDFYERMSRLKNAEDWERKYLEISDAYKKRFHDPSTDRKEETENAKKEEVELKIEDLFEGRKSND